MEMMEISLFLPSRNPKSNVSFKSIYCPFRVKTHGEGSVLIGLAMIKKELTCIKKFIILE